MSYDNRPWLKFYDDGVKHDFEHPGKTCAEMMEESFSDFADRAALHFMGSTMTFRQLDEHSRRFAAFLAEIGYGPGDVVGISLPNIPQFLIAVTGALRAGCAATGVSPLLVPKEMVYQLNDCGARVLVTLDAILEQRFTKIHEKVPELTHLVATNVAEFMPSGKVSSLPDKTVLTFPELLGKYPDKAPKVGVSLDDNCLIQYTGGTTGTPKGTELTHRNLMAGFSLKTEWFDTRRGEEVYLSGSPFFHLAGLSLGMGAIGEGWTQILIPDPRDTKHICSEFARYRPTRMAKVPSLYQMLLDEPMFRALDFSSLRSCISGAAPFPVESFKALEELVGKGKVVEIYGFTEAPPLITANPLRGTKKIGSVGVPIQGTIIKLVDLDTGTKEVPVNEEGELIARGPQMMKGYYNKPEETDHVLREFQGEKWLYSGDVARMDEDGFFTIVDRTKDMVNVGGYKVFSKEVEETLYGHPAVAFCAIVGTPNPDRPGSELVKAMIQLSRDYLDKDRGELEEDIAAFCRENMAPYKKPKTIEFVDELPLTAVGKVDKKALR